jgi:hypothetical protein
MGTILIKDLLSDLSAQGIRSPCIFIHQRTCNEIAIIKTIDQMNRGIRNNPHSYSHLVPHKYTKVYIGKNIASIW